MTPAVDPRLLRRARVARPYLVAGVVVGTVSAVLIVAQAWLVATAIGAVFDTRRFEMVSAVLPRLVAVVGGRAVLTWLQTVIAARTAAAVKSQLRADIVAARLRQPTNPSIQSGPMIALMTAGLDALDGYFGRYLPQLVLATSVPLVLGVAVVSADPISAATIAVTLPLIVIFMVLVGWMTKARIARRWRVQSRLAHHFADLVAGLPTLQVFGRAAAQTLGLKKTGAAHRHETMAILRVSFLSSLVLELVASLSVALVAVEVGLRVVHGNLSLSVALFVLMLAPEVYLPLRQVAVHYHDSVDGMAAAGRAFELIDAAAPGPLRSPHWQTPDLRRATIELADVGLRYPGAPGWAVRQLNLTISPGEVHAIVGPSGGGKSTLLSALLGFQPLAEGSITVAGHPLEALEPTEWRSRLAWVGQHPGLIGGTVADNVRLGAPGAPRSRVLRSLAAVGAADEDPDRVVLGSGENLSAGEIRRVALARALLRIDCGGGQLLILDEPTAGLDAEAELAAVNTLRTLGVTVLVVTHRSSLVRAADQIVLLTASSVDSPVLEGAVPVGMQVLNGGPLP